MSFIAQGTVQVECRTAETKAGTNAEISVVISPIPDYRVKHDGKEYVVFISANGPKSLVFDKTRPFRITNDGIRDILIKAAVNGTKTELEINDESSVTIVAVRIPATPEPKL